jgi:hypothetical protein
VFISFALVGQRFVLGRFRDCFCHELIASSSVELIIWLNFSTAFKK